MRQAITFVTVYPSITIVAHTCVGIDGIAAYTVPTWIRLTIVNN